MFMKKKCNTLTCRRPVHIKSSEAISRQLQEQVTLAGTQTAGQRLLTLAVALATAGAARSRRRSGLIRVGPTRDG